MQGALEFGRSPPFCPVGLNRVSIDPIAPQEIQVWLDRLQLPVDGACAGAVEAIALSGIPADLRERLLEQLSGQLPTCCDPSLALHQFSRFVTAAANPQALATLFERDPESLAILLRMLGLSRAVGDTLVEDPAAFDLLLLTQGQPTTLAVLQDELRAELVGAVDEAQIVRVLRRFRHRELLRIAYGEFSVGHPLERVCEQLAILAESLVSAAYDSASQLLTARRSWPLLPSGLRARFAVIGLGRFGARELGYADPLVLSFIADDAEERAAPQRHGQHEFFNTLARQVLRLLSDATEWGAVWTTEVRLGPLGEQGPLVSTLSSALHGYDVMGRIADRVSFVSARHAAGDQSLSDDLLHGLTPWIWQRYLSRLDLAGLQSLKRKLELRKTRPEAKDRIAPHEPLRDIESLIRFLQLLNGGDLMAIRASHTLQAIAALQHEGCLTPQERTMLEEHWRFFQRVDHSFQVDQWRAGTQSSEPQQALRRLAGSTVPKQSSQRVSELRLEYGERARSMHQIVDHLLHDAFGKEPELPLETELVLDPEPDLTQAARVMRAYGFREPQQAFDDLQTLAREPVAFLSSRRSRHFLAAIAPQLLREIAATPDADRTLHQLALVSDALGGKAVLWELFSASPSAQRMCVRLCAASPYLASLLTQNPGMIDELMDSLLLERLPDRSELRRELHELLRNANDALPILQSFRTAQHLRIGVRDILGKQPIETTHDALAAAAEVMVAAVVEREGHRLAARYGWPQTSGGEAAQLMILATGKLGGLEPNYHSVLELLFIYDGDGRTHREHGRGEQTTNQHFFCQLAQRIAQALSERGPRGGLYEVSVVQHLGGIGAVPAFSLEQLTRQFGSGVSPQDWLTLAKARQIYQTGHASQLLDEAIRGALLATSWQPGYATWLRQQRAQLESTASTANLKRGIGGTVDVEFITYLLQWQYAQYQPQILRTRTIDVLDACAQAGLLTATDHAALREGYLFLRRVESGLRLMNMAARHDLPSDPEEAATLAYLLGDAWPDSLLSRCEATRAEHRRLFDQFFMSAEPIG